MAKCEKCGFVFELREDTVYSNILFEVDGKELCAECVEAYYKEVIAKLKEISYDFAEDYSCRFDLHSFLANHKIYI